MYSRQPKHDRVVFKPKVIQQVRDFSSGSDVQYHSNTSPSNSNEPLLESGEEENISDNGSVSDSDDI